LTLKPNSKFDLNALPKAIEQLRYTPGAIEVTVSGVLKDHDWRKALKWGDWGDLSQSQSQSQSQSYLLLENAALEQLLSRAKPGDTISVSGEHMVYKGKPYLWLNPEKMTKEKMGSFEGKFVKSDGQLLFHVFQAVAEKGNQAGSYKNYIVLENAEREQVEAFLDNENQKKEWKISGATARYNGKDYLLIREYQIKR
jgi:hypothetical protein